MSQVDSPPFTSALPALPARPPRSSSREAAPAASQREEIDRAGMTAGSRQPPSAESGPGTAQDGDRLVALGDFEPSPAVTRVGRAEILAQLADATVGFSCQPS